MRSLLIVSFAALIATSAVAAELVVDGGFDDPSAAAWDFQKYDLTSVIERSPVDASGAPDSGSLYLDKAVGETPNSLRASQCLPVVPGADYQVSGRLFLPLASLAANGVPALAIAWNTSELCNDVPAGGGVSDFFPSLTGIARDVWVDIGPMTAHAPADALAGRLYVGVVAYTEVGSSARFVGRWDDVSIVPEPGAAASLAAIAALALLARRR